MKMPKLSNGSTGFYNERNEWQCTGSQMGRRNTIPSEDKPGKMAMRKLRFVAGCYDQGGAYWGAPANLYRAVSADVCKFGDSLQYAECYVRANSRAEAKAKVLELIPSATFFN